MQPAFDLARAAGDLDDRTDAWRFIREFATAWITPITECDGVTEEELDTAEQRLGLRLPAAIREAYRLLGRRSDLTSAYGTLRPPDQLDCDPAGMVLVFRADHQDVAFFGVSLADPALDDPPTLVYTPMMDKTQAAWEPFMDRFSLACVDMVLSECIEFGELSDGRYPDDGELPALVDGLARLPAPRYRGDHDIRRWYAGSDILLRDDDGEWVGVLGRTREALDAYRRDHPGGWVNE
jgi:hypothetical protein